MTVRDVLDPSNRGQPNSTSYEAREKITSENLFQCRLHSQGDITEGQCVKRCHDLSRIEVRSVADKISHIDDLELLMALEDILYILEGGKKISIDHPVVMNLQWSLLRPTRYITTDI